MTISWSDSQSGYLHTPTTSEEFRVSLQPYMRFRQFADCKAAPGKHRGEKFTWNVYGDTTDDGQELHDKQPMPETDFAISQGEVIIKEYGMSVPYTGRIEDLAEHDVRKIIFKTLKNNCNRKMDKLAHAAFDSTLLQYVGTGATTYDFSDTGTPGATNNSDLGIEHIKNITDEMQDRDIPTYDGEHYMCVARNRTLRAFKNDLEGMKMYTGEGYHEVVEGENGRYDGVRFLTQTNIASEGWSNGASDAAYFFGEDTVTEAIACAEELRAKVGDDYGRSKGIAWYALLAFAITHADPTSAETKRQARIVKWASAA